MAAIRVTCPACKTAFDAPADKVGEAVECPDCLEPVKVEKASGPKIKIVVTHGLPTGKRGKSKGKSRRDDDDDYEHDRHEEDDEDEDYRPPPSGGYAGGPSASVPLMLGIASLLLCIPPVGLILALAAIRTGHPDRFANPDSRGIAAFGRTLGYVTLGLYVVAIGVVIYLLKQN